MKTFSRYFLILCRVLVGIIFIFSGFVKGLDPIGYTIKISEYFTAAGLPPWEHFSLIMAVVFSTAEFILGVALLLGLVMRFTAWVSLCFMLFFIALTFVLAVFNPVTDCGCFGDAIKLTNWQTFYKNVIIILPVFYIFFSRKKYTSPFSKGFQWSIVVLVASIFTSFSIYCYQHLPAMDFMPYNVGADIKSKMQIPAGAPKDEYDTRLYYSKNGQTNEFTLQNYPWQDTTWKWVETKTVLVKKGYTPPIHDFSISNSEGISLTDSILADTSYTFLFISYNLNKANEKAFEFAEKLSLFCTSNGKHKFYALTASPSTEVNALKNKLGLTFDFCNTDETTLKTIVRANPGIVLLKNGVILGKWHYNNFEQIAIGDFNYAANLRETQNKLKDKYLSYTLLLSLALLVALLYVIALFIKKNKITTIYI